MKPHSYELHKQRLQSLCRVCGRRKKTNEHRTLCRSSAAKILAVYDIDVSHDVVERHSSRICRACFSMMRRICVNPKHVNSKEKVKIENDVKTIWVDYNDTVDISQCSSCSFWEHASKYMRKIQRVNKKRVISTECQK